MEEKEVIRTGIKKIGFAVITQALIMVCSLVSSLIIPKYMGKEMYGYWQIYYFYLNYVNFITFGYNDGLILKYGGKNKADLPIERIRSGNMIMLLISIVVAVVGTVVVNLCPLSNGLKFIYSALFLSMPVIAIFNILLSFFLAINKQEIYNKMNLLNRFLATFGYCVLLFLQMTNYHNMIIVDCLVRVIIGIGAIIIGSYFIIGRKTNWSVGIQEVKENCGHGIFITAGALLASFMPMAGRIVLQKNATIEEYAVFSFAISVLALIITFTNAAGIVFFPILKNLEQQQLLNNFHHIERIYGKFIVVGLGAYIPAVFIIEFYLTEYRSVLSYMYLIFALCIPLGKMQMLVTPYMKAFRMEKEYFIANLIGALFMLGCTSLVYKINHSVYNVAFVTLIIFEVWNIMLEKYIENKLNMKKTNPIYEIVTICVFVICASVGKISVFIVAYVVQIMILGLSILLNFDKINKKR